MRASAIEDLYVRRIDFEQRRAEQEKLGKELEPVFREFLAYAGQDLFREVRSGTRTEDHELIDLVVTLKNGKQIAIQLSFARDSDIRQAKLASIARMPIVEKLYDERGRPLYVDPMPRALLSGGNPEKWKMALEHYNSGDKPHTYFQKPEAETSFLLDQFALNFKYLATRHPDRRNFFSEYASYFEQKMGGGTMRASS
ncbi:MAG: hypothetical protein Q7S09_01010 [bacterium]|nr:hypothetical protein [bacterium]